MAILKRWRKAQDHERKHWDKVVERVKLKQDDLDWYRWKADQLKSRFLNKVLDINFEQENILEIGGGPVGIITFLKGKKRIAIDPLENFYKENPSLIRWRDNDVEYLEGVGESLPLENSNFSLVIIDNVLDHTKSPTEVLKEIFRILVPGGFMFLMVNVYSGRGLIIRSFMEAFQIDRGHPHSYSRESLRSSLENGGFEVYYEELQGYKQTIKAKLSLMNLRNKLKSILGISDIVYEVLARKG